MSAPPTLTDTQPQTSELVSRWEQLRGYALEVADVNVVLPVGIYCELVTAPNIIALPNSPDYFLGLINLRGNTVPVYSLAHAWSRAGSESVNPQSLVVIGRGDDVAAIACNAPPHSIDLTHAAVGQLSTSTDELLRPFMLRSFVVEGRTWLELDFLRTFQLLASQ